MSPLKLVAVLLIASTGLANAQVGFDKIVKMRADLLAVFGVEQFSDADPKFAGQFQGYAATLADLFEKATGQREYTDAMELKAAMEHMKDQAEFTSMIENLTDEAEKEKLTKKWEEMQEKRNQEKKDYYQAVEELTGVQYQLAGGPDSMLGEIIIPADHLMGITLEKMQNLTGVEPDEEKMMEFKQKVKMKMAMMAKKRAELGEAIEAYNETTATPEEAGTYLENKMMEARLGVEMDCMPLYFKFQGYVLKKEVVFGTMALEYAGPMGLTMKATDVKKWFKAGNCCKGDCKPMMIVRGPGKVELSQDPEDTGKKMPEN